MEDLVLRGWRLSSKTWNLITCQGWMKQWRGSELSTLGTDVYVWHYALLVVHARSDDDNEPKPYLLTLQETHNHAPDPKQPTTVSYLVTGSETTAYRTCAWFRRAQYCWKLVSTQCLTLPMLAAGSHIQPKVATPVFCSVHEQRPLSRGNDQPGYRTSLQHSMH